MYSMWSTTLGRAAVVSSRRGTTTRTYATAPKKAAVVVKPKVEVILTQDVPRVGLRGEILSVSRGFARNFLFAQKYAIHSTKTSRDKYEEFTKTIDKAASEMMKSSDKLKKKISKLTVAMKRHQVVPGKMVVPITAINIAEKMKKQHKLEFKPEQILLSIPISSYGAHNIQVDIGQGQTAQFLLTVDPR